MKNKTVSEKNYFLMQLYFWGLYLLLNLVFVSSSGFLTPLMPTLFTLLSCLLFASSHYLRKLCKHYAQSWSLKRIFLHLLWLLPVVAAVVQSILFILIYVVLQLYPSIGEQMQRASLGSFIVYTMNTCIMLVLWSAIYLLRTEFIKRRNSEIDYWRSQAKLRDIELHFLRGQINSHFLFNAINNLRSLILENPQAARQGLADLATLLRGLMEVKTQVTVSLQDELDWVRGYLALEQLQLEDRLHVDFTIDKFLLDQQLPPLALQTLTENAIKHGIAAKRGGGTISIDAQTVSETEWVLTVTNPMADLAPEHQGNKIGLQNLRERLMLAFDNKACLQLDLRENAIASIKLPLTER